MIQRITNSGAADVQSEGRANDWCLWRPRLMAESLYALWHQPRDFWADYALHKVSGYVIDREDCFLMGRGVDRFVDEEAIRAPQVMFPRSIQNAWFIWIFVGEINMMNSLAPYPLKYVGWSRRNKRIRWYESERALLRTKPDGRNRLEQEGEGADRGKRQELGREGGILPVRRDGADKL